MSDTQSLVEKRDELEARKSKLSGKLEVAKSTLNDIDQRLSELGLDPQDLEAEINRMRTERDEAIAKFTKSLEEAEKVISTIESRLQTL